MTVNFDYTIGNFQSCGTGWRVRIHFTDKVPFFSLKGNDWSVRKRNDVINQAVTVKTITAKGKTHRHVSYQPTNGIRSLHPASI